MDGKGFRYYIRAYMICCLKYQQFESKSYWSTVDYLKKPYGDHFYFFNDQQIPAIAEFLELIEEFIA
jgi:hypothetical protein